jgi:hypothetical protein
MGHYASEMGGPGFITIRKYELTEANVKKALRHLYKEVSEQYPDIKEIASINQEWITDEKSRKWVRVNYLSIKYPGSTCTTELSWFHLPDKKYEEYTTDN